eukprot:6214564-Pleurochrysis_carterae.AAC.4
MFPVSVRGGSRRRATWRGVAAMATLPVDIQMQKSNGEARGSQRAGSWNASVRVKIRSLLTPARAT